MRLNWPQKLLSSDVAGYVGIILFCFGFSSPLIYSPVLAQEKVMLSAPVQTDSGATEFRITMIHMDLEAENLIIRLREIKPDINAKPDFSGKVITATYTGSLAATFIKALNKVDLSVKSLQRRILERLQTDGKLNAGAISGAPQ